MLSPVSLGHWEKQSHMQRWENYAVTCGNSGGLHSPSVILSEVIGIPLSCLSFFLSAVKQTWELIKQHPCESQLKRRWAGICDRAVPAGHWSSGGWQSEHRAFYHQQKSPWVTQSCRGREKKERWCRLGSRDCMSSLSAHNALLSLDTHRLMPLTLWLNISLLHNLF